MTSKGIMRLLTVCLLALPTFSCGQALQEVEGLPAIIIANDEQIKNKDVLPNHYIAMFKAQAGIDHVDFATYHEETGFYAGFLADRYDYDYEVKDIRLITALRLPTADYSPPYSLWWQAQHGHAAWRGYAWQEDTSNAEVGLITEVIFASNAAAARYLRAWHAMGLLYFAEPVYISYPNASFEEMHDLYSRASGENWWHEEIGLIKAYSLLADPNNTGNGKRFRTLETLNPPIVAVLDSGIDYEHPALKDQMFKLKNNEKTGLCGNDTYGCNTAIDYGKCGKSCKGQLGDGNSHPWGTGKAGQDCPKTHRSCAHGTHVAGIVAASNAGQGEPPVMGVCPFCKLLNIRVMSTSGKEIRKDSDGIVRTYINGSVTDGAILNALKYIEALIRDGKTSNIRVVNASIGKFHRSRSVALLAANLRRPLGNEELGIITVAAAGNESTKIRNYPAALKAVISVAATDVNGTKASFSNYGVSIDIAAPGSRIKSTVPGGTMKIDSGTSMAAPVVAGVLGLGFAVLKDKNNNRMSANDMLDILMHFSNEMKLYCLHPKSPLYVQLPLDQERIRIPAERYQKESSEYRIEKKKAFEELCADLTLPEETFLTALRNKEYYVEFSEYRDKIPLLGLGQVDAEAMLRRKPSQLNPLLNFTLELKRVPDYSCSTLGGTHAAGSAALLLLLCLPISLFIRRYHT
ncbi:MAG: S8 family serine peptidase [Pseudomonadota bacterium]|nr:S8 family serine peptidase [Pseudomonadota bacterium]